MFAFLVRRLAMVVPTLFVVSVIVFSLQLLLPGDPASVLAGEDRNEQTLAEIRQRYGLDQPLHVQYVRWIWNALNGDLGESMRIGLPVGELVMSKLPVTLQLGAMAFVIACLIGIPMGVVLGREEGHGVGLCRQRGGAVGPVDAEFLARHPADPSRFRPSRLAAAVGLCQPVRGLAAEPRHHDHAGLRARQFASRPC